MFCMCTYRFSWFNDVMLTVGGPLYFTYMLYVHKKEINVQEIRRSLKFAQMVFIFPTNPSQSLVTSTKSSLKSLRLCTSRVHSLFN